MSTSADWQPLFSVQAGAAATLMGLIFVAVSINLSKVIEVPGLSGRAGESILQFFQVFFISTVSLVPRQSMTALATEILIIAGCCWLAQVITHIRYSKARTGHPLIWLITRVVQTQVASIPFFIAGTYLLLGSPTGLYWLVPGFVFSFFSGVASAWVLLVEVLR